MNINRLLINVKNYLKENWFKIAIIIITTYAMLSFLSAYQDQENRQVWAQERIKAYEICLSTVLPVDFSKAGYTSSYDGFKASFRACKSVSDNF